MNRYNSAVINTVAVWNYNVVLANNTFVQDELWQQYQSSTNASQTVIQMRNAFFSDPPPQRFENEDCVKAYGRNLQTTRGDVALVYQYGGSNISAGHSSWDVSGDVFGDVSGAGILGYGQQVFGPDNALPDQNAWICPDQNDPKLTIGAQGTPHCASELPRIEANADSWAPFSGAVVDYCLSKPMPELCEVNFSLPIAIVVILVNAFKAIIMALAVFTIKEQPLVTIWDAAASFLKERDTASNGMSLASRKDFEKERKCRTLVSPPPLPRRWTAERTRLFQAASIVRWASVISLYDHVSEDMVSGSADLFLGM